MKYDVTKPEAIISGSLESADIHLGETDVVFDLLRKQYTFPIQTPLQEMLSNARDSHRQAKQKRKIEVKFSTESYPFFSTRDFGVSMSPEFFKSFWAGMGNSSKKTSNEFTGGFGIGSKAWFAYRNNWFYKIYYGGKVRTYEITTALKYAGSIELRDESDSDEPQGIEVVVPVNKGDEDTFMSAFYRATLFWTDDERPIVKNRETEELSQLWTNKQNFLSLIPEITLVSPETIKSFSRNYQNKTDLILSIDGIPYIINAKLLNSQISGDYAFESEYAVDNAYEEITSIKESLKHLAPICDIFRCAYSDEASFVPIFNIKVGEIKLVNHRENIDFGDDNIKKTIELVISHKLKLDVELLNNCKKLLVSNKYKQAKEFSSQYQPHWIITEEKNKYKDYFLPSPFEFRQIISKRKSGWAWIHFNNNQLRNVISFSYHKDPNKRLIFEHGRPLNFNPKRSSILLLKDEVEKKDILIKKKMNMLNILDLYVVDVSTLPEEVKIGFYNLCDNKTFGEWWIETGLPDQEIKKVVKKDNSIISLHYMDKGKKCSESKKIDEFLLSEKFKKTIFIKMKNNKADSDYPCITFLFDFIKSFFNIYTAMVTEDNYNKLQNLLGDDFNDFNLFLDKLKNPSEDTYSKIRTLFYKGFLHKAYTNHDYEFRTIKPFKNIVSSNNYTTELSLYLMMNDVGLKFNKPALKKLESLGSDLNSIQSFLISISKTEPKERTDFREESKKMDLLAYSNLLKSFPKLYSILEEIEQAYLLVETNLRKMVPYVSHIVSNGKQGYIHDKIKGCEYEIHPYIIENIKIVENKK